jgi:hypothetical protein
MMTIKAMQMKINLLVVLLLTVLLAVTGCSALKSKKGAPEPSPAATVQPAQSKTMYLDFGDVLLPKELKVDRDESFVFTTAGMTAGVLVLSGRVDASSLVTFFENRMPEDGWQMISAIKAARSMLLFKKQARWCVVSIEEGRFSTRAEISVAPTMVPEPAGLHK